MMERRARRLGSVEGRSKNSGGTSGAGLGRLLVPLGALLRVPPKGESYPLPCPPALNAPHAARMLLRMSLGGSLETLIQP